ncbi:MAG TPA: redoxin domain-containing protein [Bryobacteraceae bacterium]|nr:redoxin domain-containing protein [Bryobacteraceae bacterium]
MRTLFGVCSLLCLCSALPALAASGLSCESTPAVEAVMRESGQQRPTVTLQESLVLARQAYEKMHRLDPSDYRPVRRYYMFTVRYDEPEKWDAVRDQFVADAHSHPDDALKLTIAARALSRKDTPQAMRFLEQAIAANPNYAPAYLELSGYYDGSGKYIDKTKALTYLEKFYQLCPSSRDEFALFHLKKMESNELKGAVARSLRQRLATATDPYVLLSYSDVWALEFSNLPVNEHPKERQRIAEDLHRLEKLPIQPTAEWLAFLKDGYKQSGAPEAQVKALEARITIEFPHSSEAADIIRETWENQHPTPTPEASASDWQQYLRLELAHDRDQLQRFPQQRFLNYFLFADTAHLDGEPPAEIIREGERYIQQSDLYEGPSSDTREQVAEALLDHHIEPARALELLQQARRLRDSPGERINFEPPDYAKPKELEDLAAEHAASETHFRVLYLRACRAASDPSAAAALAAQVEAAEPANDKAPDAYWQARALLAEIQHRIPDALTYYQKALALREPPKKQYGVLNDTLLADAQHVWKDAGGSEAAFAIWSKPDSSQKPALAEGRWEKPDKELPAFELADLAGKTWKLKSLEGQKVLINVWATWCGPCQAELPQLQKLYEQTKDRTDIRILTLNFDEDIGLIEPFVKKKGFTFPVLPAYSLLANRVDVNSIPRNWLIDANGKWQWEQIGFDSSESDWGKNMLNRLESLK